MQISDRRDKYDSLYDKTKKLLNSYKNTSTSLSLSFKAKRHRHSFCKLLSHAALDVVMLIAHLSAKLNADVHAIFLRDKALDDGG